MEELAINFFEEIKPLIEEYRKVEKSELLEIESTEESVSNLNEEINKEDEDRKVNIKQLKGQIYRKTKEFIDEYRTRCMDEIEKIEIELDTIKSKHKSLVEKRIKYINLKREYRDDPKVYKAAKQTEKDIIKEMRAGLKKQDTLNKELDEQKKELSDFEEIMGSLDFSNSDYISSLENMINIKEKKEKEIDDLEEDTLNIEKKEAEERLEKIFDKVKDYIVIPESVKDVLREYPEDSNMFFKTGDESYKLAVIGNFEEETNKYNDMDLIMNIMRGIVQNQKVVQQNKNPKSPATSKIHTGKQADELRRKMAEIKAGQKSEGEKVGTKAGKKPTQQKPVQQNPAKQQGKAGINANQTQSKQHAKIEIRPDQDKIMIYFRGKEEPIEYRNILKLSKEGKKLRAGQDLFKVKGIDNTHPAILAVLDKLEKDQICEGIKLDYINSFTPEMPIQVIDSINYIFDRKSDKVRNYRKVEKDCKKYAKLGVEFGIAEVKKIDGTKGKFHRFLDKIFDKFMKPKRFPTVENKEDSKIAEEPKILSKAEERKQFINNMPKSKIRTKATNSLIKEKASDIAHNQDKRFDKMKRGAPVVSRKFKDNER